LLAYLRERRILLILDNLEHLLDAAGTTPDVLAGILHNAHSAVQQVIVLTVLEQIQGPLADLDAPRSASVDGA
ncbi:hypothetical protein SE17_35175, partial [Kouleothrix aurantiaca]